MKIRGFLKQHGLVTGLAVLLLVAFALLIKLGSDLRTATTCVLPGSYMTENTTPGGGEYLVFDPDGRFFRYVQFEMLGEGTYTGQGSQIYTLSGESGQNDWVVCTPDGVYLFDSNQNQAQFFRKCSDVPTFINVGAKGGGVRE